MVKMHWLRKPHNRVKAAWALLVISVVLWPLSALTVAKGEPQVVLALSFFALIYTSLDIIATTDIKGGK